MYGPPVTYWTARFESKHRIAKVRRKNLMGTVFVLKWSGVVFNIN